MAIQVSDIVEDSVIEWFNSLLASNVNDGLYCQFVNTVFTKAWCIWCARNSLVFKNEEYNPIQVGCYNV